MSNIIDNLYKRPKREKKHESAHFSDVPDNSYHQADLLFLPTDNGHKYALVVVDVGSRIVDAVPLKSKSSDSVIAGFRKIYESHKILKPPTNTITVDSGSEFKGSTKKYFENVLKVNVRVAKVGRHRQVAIVERKNQDIGNKLFRRMTAEELLTGEVSRAWVEYLPKVIRNINTHTKKTFVRPIPSGKYTFKGDVIPQGTKVRVVLDKPISILGDKLHGKFRSSDIRYSPTPHTITESIIFPDSAPLYVLDNDRSVSYTKGQLQVIPKDETYPTADVILGTKEKGIKKYVIEKLLDRKKVNGRVYFSVKWAGYDKPELSLRSDLMKDVPELVKEFESKK
jgi:hypothetical protein